MKNKTANLNIVNYGGGGGGLGKCFKSIIDWGGGQWFTWNMTSFDE